MNTILNKRTATGTIILTLIVFSVILVLGSGSGVPNKVRENMSVETKIMDADGNVLPGAYAIDVRIRDQPGGTVLWTDTQSVEADNSGIADFYTGSLNASIFLNQKTPCLELVINGSSLPCVSLGTVYAAYVADIAYAVNNSAGYIDVGSGPIITTGNLTDGTNSLTIANAKAAYDHIGNTNNPHNVTASDIGAFQDAPDSINDTHMDWGSGTGQVDTDDIPEGSTNKFVNSTKESNWNTAYDHTSSTSNPHSVTLSQARTAGGCSGCIVAADIGAIGACSNICTDADTDTDTTVDGCSSCLAIGVEVADPGGLANGDDVDDAIASCSSVYSCTSPSSGFCTAITGHGCGYDNYEADTDTTVDGCSSCLTIGVEVADPGGLADGDDDTDTNTQCEDQSCSRLYLDGTGNNKIDTSSASGAATGNLYWGNKQITTEDIDTDTTVDGCSSCLAIGAEVAEPGTYIKKDGSVAMAANLDMGDYSIADVNTINSDKTMLSLLGANHVYFYTDDDGTSGGPYYCYISGTDGTFNCNPGPKNAVIEVDGETYYTHALEAETVDFQIRGSSETVDGNIEITVDETFQLLISDSTELQVITQPTEACSLYVTNTTWNSFTVVSWTGQKNCKFDYVVYAIRKGYDGVGFNKSG